MIDVIDEKLVSLPEVESILKKIKPEDMSYEQKNAYDHAKSCSKLTLEEANELKEKIKNLGLRTVKENHIIQIIDILPKTMEDLQIIFKNAPIKPNELDLGEILKIVKEYVKE